MEHSYSKQLSETEKEYFSLVEHCKLSNVYFIQLGFVFVDTAPYVAEA